MSLFERLKDNKGTVSSALGKLLAAEVLAGDQKMLEEAVDLTCYDLPNIKSKSIRAGAAKIVEIVAEKEPELVSPYLEVLLPSLEAKEPQTRWMIMMVFGFCAKVNEPSAKKGIPYAKRYIEENEGLCIKSAADLYLGQYGALSVENTKAVLPLVQVAMNTCIKNEQDWLIESLIRMAPHMTGAQIDLVMSFVMKYHDDSRKATAKRVTKFLKSVDAHI